ncbi:MAG: hypothetical protein LBO66_12005, partial [Deltaproteobacteria bacterium]|nr:hypothetical protein [Deltaproteobacteria bacterium]
LKKSRDPVAPAKASDVAIKKASSKRNSDDIPIVKFDLALESLKSISVPSIAFQDLKTGKKACFILRPELSPFQQKACQLIKEIPKYP